jgi:hypothetical protein
MGFEKTDFSYKAFISIRCDRIEVVLLMCGSMFLEVLTYRWIECVN